MVNSFIANTPPSATAKTVFCILDLTKSKPAHRACADPINLNLDTFRGTALAANAPEKHLLTEVDLGQAILWTERAENHTVTLAAVLR